MKAILVVDFPKDGCRNCQFNIGGSLCTARSIEDEEDGCPLKSMPHKKQISLREDYDVYYKMGWNDCIDELLGETE